MESHSRNREEVGRAVDRFPYRLSGDDGAATGSGAFPKFDEQSAHERLRIVPVGAIYAPAGLFIRESMLNLALADPSDAINILIASGGGDQWECLVIMDAIRMVKGLLNEDVPIVGIVNGMAASAGLTVLQTCDVRKMTKHSVLMAHGIYSEVAGGATVHDRLRKVLAYLCDELAELYASRTKVSKGDWDKIMEDERATYFTSQEALEKGLVDEIVN